MNKPKLMDPETQSELQVPQEFEGQRIDVFLAHEFKAYSRSYFKNLIEKDLIKLNGIVIKKAGFIVRAHDCVTVEFPPLPSLSNAVIPENLGVEVIFTHPDFFIIYKPANLVVHSPSQLSTIVTLVDWLIQHYKELKLVGLSDRPGIVHRLDKDTSGILIIARNNYAHTLFSDMFKDRCISKTYIAIVQGHPEKEGTINFPISRHPIHKHKMTHTNERGRSSVTHYIVLEYLKDAALVEVQPITGRTHQIRVHMAAIGHPIIGDSIYGKSSKLIERQALHAFKLCFCYETILYTFWRDIPEDMKKLIDSLR